MTMDEVIQFAFQKGRTQAEQEDAILDKEGYAQFYALCEKEFRGPQNCYHHRRQYGVVDVTPSITLIQDSEVEKAVLIAIEGNIIKDNFIIDGSENEIHAEQYFIRNQFGVCAVDFILKWEKAGAQICNYHNHTMNIAAIPSDQDINSLSYEYHYTASGTEWKAAVDKYGIDIPDGFQYSDWGVVTVFDFFSYQHAIKNGITAESLLSINKENKRKWMKGVKRYIDKESTCYSMIELELCSCDD